MKKLELTAFIVPNSVCNFAGYNGHPWGRYIKEYLGHIGISVEANDPLLEIWVTSEGHDNNTDHGYGDEQLEALGLPLDADGTGMAHDAVGIIHAPDHIPYRVVKDVKEGDVKTFTAPNGCEVRITFAQLPYRYRSFGRFEEVVEALMAAYMRRNAKSA